MNIKIIIIMFVLLYLFIYKRKLYSSNIIFTDLDQNLTSTTNPTINKNKSQSKNLMIVAHPDDEIVFGGKELFNGNWKVVCVTNATTKSQNKFTLIKSNRKKEFIKAMKKLKCSYEIWDHEDSLFSADWNKKILIENLKRILTEEKYNMIVTHNLNGEYGHIQHKQISKLIHKLNPPNLYVFENDTQIINPYFFELKNIFNNCYGNKQCKKYDKFILHQTIQKVN